MMGEKVQHVYWIIRSAPEGYGGWGQGVYDALAEAQRVLTLCEQQYPEENWLLVPVPCDERGQQTGGYFFNALPLTS